MFWKSKWLLVVSINVHPPFGSMVFAATPSIGYLEDFPTNRKRFIAIIYIYIYCNAFIDGISVPNPQIGNVQVAFEKSEYFPALFDMWKLYPFNLSIPSSFWWLKSPENHMKKSTMNHAIAIETIR